MAYKMSRGKRGFGDIEFEDDADTGIDFAPDQISLETSGTVRMNITNDGVYIPDTPADYSLKVSGAIEITPGTSAGITFKKSESEINFIKFANASDGTSYNAYLAYQAAEHLYIAPGRGADFYIQARGPGGGDQWTFPFRVMDDGTARFEKGLEDSATSVADLTASTAFYVSGTQDGNNNAVFLGRVGIGTATPDYTLDVAGNIGVDQYIRHNDNGNTHINFTVDKINLKAGNKSMVTMEEKGTSPHEVTINDGSNNIDFVVKGNGSNKGNPLLMCDASNNRVGINGVGSPSWELDVDGDIGLAEYIYHRGDTDTFIKFGDDAITLKAGGKSMLKASASVGSIFVNNGGHDIDFVVRNAVTGTLLFADAGNSRVGINNGAPTEALDVSGTVRNNGGVYRKVRDEGSTNNITTSDYVIRCIQNGAITLTLPTRSNNAGQIVIIKDALGNAGSPNNRTITIAAATNETVDGQANTVINMNHGFATLICDGINGWMRIG